MATEKLKVSVQEVEKLLEEGMNRQEIAEHYGISYSILQKTVFQHPKLKGRKPKKVYDIEVFDEEENGGTLDLGNNSSEEELRGEESVTENPAEEVEESTSNWE